jgi:hypothetical protein
VLPDALVTEAQTWPASLTANAALYANPVGCPRYWIPAPGVWRQALNPRSRPAGRVVEAEGLVIRAPGVTSTMPLPAFHENACHNVVVGSDSLVPPTTPTG